MKSYHNLPFVLDSHSFYLRPIIIIIINHLPSITVFSNFHLSNPSHSNFDLLVSIFKRGKPSATKQSDCGNWVGWRNAITLWHQSPLAFSKLGAEFTVLNDITFHQPHHSAPSMWSGFGYQLQTCKRESRANQTESREAQVHSHRILDPSGSAPYLLGTPLIETCILGTAH